ncbi:Cyclin-dependent kinase 20 [Dissophora globulifera]|uniref:Cyclin-dependent kinase 20 n=1 Tax=Dissophora globulifera TaxID=979702 RepID=A0A9P6UVL0_9FUNG|nr:Cyclin-dependent kinase 20 [Dissophora globulifera]
MHVLRTLEVLYENPYTGDKITKARIVPFNPTILSAASSIPDTENLASEQAPDPFAFTSSADKQLHTPALYNKEPNRRLPEFVAIKYLSDYRTIRKRPSRTQGQGGWNSSDDSDDTADEDEQVNLDDSVELLGEVRVPEGIRFGPKAKREIRALRAAQGHHHVIPFLGFTGPPLPNLFKVAMRQQPQSSNNLSNDDASCGSLLTGLVHSSRDTAPLDWSGSRETESLGGSLLGPPLGRSLFQDEDRDQNLAPPFHPTEASQPISPSLLALDTTAKELFPTIHFRSGSNSDNGCSRSSSDDDDDDDDDDDEGAYWEELLNAGDIAPTTLTAEKWRRVFGRQPRIGGILLPYTPLSLMDLIKVGWTKTRPLLVETCMQQVLQGLVWIHEEAGLIHRDISASNIVVRFDDGTPGTMGSDAGRRGLVHCMISDFGCATFHQTHATAGGTDCEVYTGDQPSGIGGDVDGLQDMPYDYYSQQQRRDGLTFEVGTRAYRAPELLFSSRNYTNAIDIWSAGVLFAEMYLGRTLFEADSDIGQIAAIVQVLGTPTNSNWPEFPTMPDYGKLQFQALKTTPLSTILFVAHLNPAVTQDGTRSADITAGSQDPDAPPSGTLVSEAAFELIERMIVYSGAARPTARETLRLMEGNFVSMAQLEQSRLAPFGFQDVGDGRVENVAHEQAPEDDPRVEFLRQCVLDESQILDEKRRLDNDEYDSDYEEGHGFRPSHFDSGDDPRELNFDDDDNYDDGDENEADQWQFHGASLRELEAGNRLDIPTYSERDSLTTEDAESGPERIVKRYRTTSEGGGEIGEAKS